MIVMLFNAVILGFAIAIPVGPVSLLCMHRTLDRGRLAGMATGLGVAAADSFFAALAAGGLSVGAEFLVAQAPWLKFAAGLFVAALGLRILMAPRAKEAARVSEGTLGWCFMSGFLLTLTNPVAILLLVAGFAVLGLAGTDIDFPTGCLLVVGVFLGSAVWWVGLVAGVSTIRRQVPLKVLEWANRATGLSFVAFGAFVIGHALS